MPTSDRPYEDPSTSAAEGRLQEKDGMRPDGYTFATKDASVDRPRESIHPGAHTAQRSSIWSLYYSKAKLQDKVVMENIKADTDSILTFTGLFSATVAAFIIESYKNLQPDAPDASVLLLSRISAQLAAGASGAQALANLPPLPEPSSFRPSPAALRVNICWFLSLSLSLSCALAATLMQQWSRRYLQDAQSAQSASTPEKQGRIHAYVFMGLERFGMKTAIEVLPAILHAAVGLFFAGLVQFLFTVNQFLVSVILVTVTFGAITYLAITLLPFIYLRSPYSTPFSLILPKSAQAVREWPLTICHFLVGPPFHRRRTTTAALSDYVTKLRTTLRLPRFAKFVSFVRHAMSPCLFIGDSMLHLMIKLAAYLEAQRRDPNPFASRPSQLEKAAERDARLPGSVLNWTWVAVMDKDDEVEAFTNGIVEFLTSPDNLAHPDDADVLVAGDFGHLISQMLSYATTEKQSIGRPIHQQHVLSCLRLLRELLATQRGRNVLPTSFLWPHILTPIVPHVDRLRRNFQLDADTMLSAACTAAEMAGFLDHLLEAGDYAWHISGAVARDFEECLRQLVDRENLLVPLRDLYARGRVCNVQTLARVAISRSRLQSASLDTVKLVADTLSTLPLPDFSCGFEGDSAEWLEWMKHECTLLQRTLLFLRLEIAGAAMRAGAFNPDGVEDGRIAMGFAEDSLHGHLYNCLRPLRRWSNICAREHGLPLLTQLAWEQWVKLGVHLEPLEVLLEQQASQETPTRTHIIRPYASASNMSALSRAQSSPSGQPSEHLDDTLVDAASVFTFWESDIDVGCAEEQESARSTLGFGSGRLKRASWRSLYTTS